jgi:hypothetical protein
MEAPAAPPPTSPSPSFFNRIWAKLKDRRFLFVSVLVHVLFAVIAIYLVVQTITPKRKLTFKGGPPSPNPSQRVMEHKVSLAKKQKTMSAPAPAKRITTTAMSKVALPEMPAMPTMDNSPLSKMSGMAPGGLGMTMGSSGGTGSSGGGGGGVPFFGLRTGEGLQGTFYDLKQTRARQPTGMTPEKYSDVVRRFVTGNWDEAASFSRYFKAPNPLIAQQIIVPAIQATEGPKAFDLADKVQPKMWVIVYRATVVPPYGGNVRFVGKGDDIMIVRFNGRVVLDWSQPDAGKLSNWRPHTKAYKYPFTNNFGVMPGDWVSVEAGKPYEMEVLIGERPGGGFQASLFIERGAGKYEKNSSGDPILPLFRLAGGEFKLPAGAKAPPFAQNAEPWKAVKGVNPGSMLQLPR